MIECIPKVFPKAKIIQSIKPNGGSSAEMRIVTLLLADGTSSKVILRWHRHIEQEYKLISWLHTAGLLAPKPIFWDEPNQVLMLEVIEGENRFDHAPSPAIGRAIGQQLARIHGTAIPAKEKQLLPVQPTDLGSNTQAHREEEIRDILDPLWPNKELEPKVLIHGDFWPGNLLWQGDALVGVIDWEDAKLGNRYQDLAISRFDCAFIFGRETMHTLTAEYGLRYPIDPKQLALWDLYAALRAARGIPDWAEGYAELGRPDLTEAAIWKTHRWFIDQAVATLNGS